MKKIILSAALLFCSGLATINAQNRLFDYAGKVVFLSQTSPDVILALNSEVTAVIDVASQNVAVSMDMEDFQFDEILTQMNFKETVLEASKYPKSVYAGEIPIPIDFDQIGKIEYVALGDLDIHGITRPVEITTTFNIFENEVAVETNFSVRLEDFQIILPPMIVENMDDRIRVKANFKFPKTAEL